MKSGAVSRILSNIRLLFFRESHDRTYDRDSQKKKMKDERTGGRRMMDTNRLSPRLQSYLSSLALKGEEREGKDKMAPAEIKNEPTWRCHPNPFIGAFGIQEPVIPGEPLFKR